MKPQPAANACTTKDDPFPIFIALISVSSPRARTRGGRECHPRELVMARQYSCIAHTHTSSRLVPGSPHRSDCARGFRTWALDVADDAASGVVHELNSDLGNTAARTCRPSEPHLPFLPRTHRRVATIRDGALCIPVRPKTRVTLTSFTGTLEEASILANSGKKLSAGRQTAVQLSAHT